MELGQDYLAVTCHHECRVQFEEIKSLLRKKLPEKMLIPNSHIAYKENIYPTKYNYHLSYLAVTCHHECRVQFEEIKSLLRKKLPEKMLIPNSHIAYKENIYPTKYNYYLSGHSVLPL